MGHAIQDDFKWPFGGKNKTKNRGEYEKDGGPGRASNINRIEVPHMHSAQQKSR